MSAQNNYNKWRPRALLALGLFAGGMVGLIMGTRTIDPWTKLAVQGFSLAVMFVGLVVARTLRKGR